MAANDGVGGKDVMSLMDHTLWNRQMKDVTLDVVDLLVRQIYAGIRGYVVQSVELKFNCFFLMPLMHEFAGFLRQEMEVAFEENLDAVFDVRMVRAALEERQRKLESELGQMEHIQEKFATIHNQLELQAQGSPATTAAAAAARARRRFLRNRRRARNRGDGGGDARVAGDGGGDQTRQQGVRAPLSVEEVLRVAHAQQDARAPRKRRELRRLLRTRVARETSECTHYRTHLSPINKSTRREFKSPRNATRERTRDVPSSTSYLSSITARGGSSTG